MSDIHRLGMNESFTVHIRLFIVLLNGETFYKARDPILQKCMIFLAVEKGLLHRMLQILYLASFILSSQNLTVIEIFKDVGFILQGQCT